MPDVSVIIVNWNSGNQLRECLASLHSSGEARGTEIEAIVVDNGSTDDSLSMAGDHPRSVLIRCASNLGFAAACNRGAAAARGECLLFLNPDCRVAAGSIDAARAALQGDPCIGVVGIALAGDDGQVSRSCHRFPQLRHFLFRATGLSAVSARFPDGAMRDWGHDCDRIVDHVIGAFYMVRADQFRALGGFDERFFVYFEDLDLSLRYARRGQRCLFLARPLSYHKGGGISEQARAARLFHSTRSRILYAYKHFPRWQAWVHLMATCTVEPVARLVGLAVRRRSREVREVLEGFAMLYRDLPATLHLANGG